ncbi:hypothetical protein M422DRAFT_777232 [Sphaerobolus stellatus SS14]|nr:hypothetical protein M422DRAFT_777232 [Sphaerobolus stellatus SS14]
MLRWDVRSDPENAWCENTFVLQALATVPAQERISMYISIPALSNTSSESRSRRRVDISFRQDSNTLSISILLTPKSRKTQSTSQSLQSKERLSYLATMRGIKVVDVLVAVHTLLQEKVTKNDFGDLDEEDQQQSTESFYMRCSSEIWIKNPLRNYSQEEAEASFYEVRQQGMKIIDLLGENYWWSGLTPRMKEGEWDLRLKNLRYY